MSLSDTPTQITAALRAWNAGEPGALERLIPLVYDELRHIAEHYLRQEQHVRTIQPTELVHEAFVRFCGHHRPDWKNRAHFFGAAAELMRRILVDYSRRRNAVKRGGATLVRVDLADSEVARESRDFDFEVLDRALARLAGIDARNARLVQLRFFGGLTIEECADVLGISPATVKRDWLLAKAWLLREIS